MKITANRKEEILKRKAEYEAEEAEIRKDNQARWNAYQDDVDKITKPVQDEIEYNLSKFSALSFVITVEEARWRTPGIHVHISCDENRKRDDNVALAWSYDAQLEKDADTGEYHAKRETSSWSGLQATTPSQLRSLQQTVLALDYLNTLDWDDLLNKTMPDAAKYYEGAKNVPPRPNFEQEMVEAELEELIGQNKLIRVRPFESSGYRGDVYVKLIGQTPSQYVVQVVPQSYATRPEDITNWLSRFNATQRVKKSNIKPVQPTNIVDLDAEV